MSEISAHQESHTQPEIKDHGRVARLASKAALLGCVAFSVLTVTHDTNEPLGNMDFSAIPFMDQIPFDEKRVLDFAGAAAFGIIAIGAHQLAREQTNDNQ